MNVEISIETTDSQGRTFLTWAPIKASARVTEADGASGAIAVTLANGGVDGGGRVVFDTVRSDDDKPTLDLELPANGNPVDFWVAGEFGHPSLAYGDAAVEATADGNVVGRRELMVRIRKNAMTLTDAERDRFLHAMGTLNEAGQGPFKSFRAMHVDESNDESHNFAGFGPWHRAYLLDLERELQKIDAEVALPYWRFDEPAPSLFAAEFLGSPSDDSSAGDDIDFPAGHPLEFWQTNEGDPIRRRPLFFYDINAAPPTELDFGPPDGIQPFVITEADTIALGDVFSDFRQPMEFTPHGAAHSCFSGWVGGIDTAAKDPLFFLLHANVDRLWARWQWLKQRTKPSQAATYSIDGSRRDPPKDIGHKLNDTMWPWNGIKGNGTRSNPRPQFDPPRPTFPDSPIVRRPGSKPRVRDMIDYQGVHGDEPLGFDYDDVPFELH
ncbi:MAG TPA: tyrosinase family protein [Sphingomicrobium sp.]